MMLHVNMHRKKSHLECCHFKHRITLLQENQNKIHKICEASSFEACNVELLIKKETNLISLTMDNSMRSRILGVL